MSKTAPQEAPAGLSMADLAAWHTEQADNAAARALEGFRVASKYREAGRNFMHVTAAQHESVAELASAHSRFHASAALLCLEHA